MKSKLFVVSLLFAAAASAQSDSAGFFNRVILGRGVGNIGSRGGEQVDLRFFVGINGVADGSLQFLQTDSEGNLIHSGMLTGVSLTGGVYGVHNWKRAQLGVDYHGDLRHYFGDSRYDNSGNRLLLGYTFHPNNRVILDFRAGGALFTQAYYGFFSDLADPNAIAIASLVDSPYYGLNSEATVTYLASARTSFSVGGAGRYQYRGGQTIFETTGFSGTGSAYHRLSEQTSVGVDYLYSLDQARDGSFSFAIHSVTGRYNVQIGPAWTVKLGGGVYIANIDQKIAVRLDPALALVFGTDTLILPIQKQTIAPNGSISIERLVKRTAFSLYASRSVLSGAGVYTPSTTETAGTSYTYTALRRWSLGIGANVMRLRGVGTSAAAYTVVGAGPTFTYEVVPSLHFVASYNIRHFDVIQSGYRRNPSQFSVGFTFSPGTIPLSFR